MNEETISKVLTGETDIAKMSHDDFVEMLKYLGRMYFSRVMNCVYGTGKSDKEWTALSCIFSRVVEAITEKPKRNCDKYATLEEAEKAYGNTPHLGAADDDPDGPKEYIIPFKRWLFDPVADTGAVSPKCAIPLLGL